MTGVRPRPANKKNGNLMFAQSIQVTLDGHQWENTVDCLREVGAEALAREINEQVDAAILRRLARRLQERRAQLAQLPLPFDRVIPEAGEADGGLITQPARPPNKTPGGPPWGPP